MKAQRAAALVLTAFAVVLASCGSSEEPASTTTLPPLSTVPPLDPSVTIATRPPPTTTTTPGGLPTTVPTTSPPRPDVERFIPTLPLEDGMVTLDVTFVDGSRATVSWPSGLDITSHGLVPYGWAFIAGSTARDFFIRPGPVGAVLDRLGGAQLVEEYPDADGGMVGVWRPEGDEVDYLGFQFDGWTVLVFDYRGGPQMSAEDRAIWATNFRGEETEDGFLVLSAEDPLQLVYAGDYPVPLNMTLRGDDGEVKLVPGTCTPGPVLALGDGDGVASQCIDSGDFSVEAYGSEDFQTTALGAITVESVEIAVPPPPSEDEAEA